jgi:NADPH:quinone reductase
VGFAGGDIPRIPLNLPLLKGCAITGVYWGEFARRDPAANREHMGRLLGWLAQGRLRPRISGTFPLAGAGEALRALLARNVTGKLVLIVDR